MLGSKDRLRHHMMMLFSRMYRDVLRLCVCFDMMCCTVSRISRVNVSSRLVSSLISSFVDVVESVVQT